LFDPHYTTWLIGGLILPLIGMPIKQSAIEWDSGIFHGSLGLFSWNQWGYHGIYNLLGGYNLGVISG
jgi:hypothetical protein